MSTRHPSPPPTIISPSPQLNLPFALPVPQPTFGALSLSTPSHDTTDLLDALHPPPPSPSLTYFTAPSSPLTQHTPRSSPMPRSQSSPPHHSSTDDYFPSPSTSRPYSLLRRFNSSRKHLSLFLLRCLFSPCLYFPCSSWISRRWPGHSSRSSRLRSATVKTPCNGRWCSVPNVSTCSGIDVLAFQMNP